MESELAFPLDEPLAAIQRWREKERIRLRDLLPVVVRGSLASDVPAYLERVRKRPASWKAKRAELRAWVAVLDGAIGRKRRHQVKPQDVDAAIAAWLEAGVAPKTVLNRCRTLHHLYVTLANDPKTRTPLDGIDVPRAPRRAPQFVSADIIKRVERTLRAAAADVPAPTAGGGLTREAWYALVWQSPLTTLARQRGVSNTAIAQLCRRLHVPTPPAGYWAKHRVGRASAPPPLPALPQAPPRRTESAALRRLVHAFFMVVASTGLRPSQVNRVMQTVRDEDVARRVVLVEGGKGGEPIPLWLNNDQQAAFQALLAARIPVPDSAQPQFVRMDATRYARAVRAAGWPSDVRPYNARHAVGIELAELGAEDADIQAQLGHTDLAMVRRHYTGVRLSKMKRISESLEGRLGWGENAPTDAPTTDGGSWRELAETGGKTTGRNRA